MPNSNPSNQQGVEFDRAVLDSLRATTDALKTMNPDSNVGKADEVMVDLREQIRAVGEVRHACFVQHCFLQN